MEPTTQFAGKQVGKSKRVKIGFYFLLDNKEVTRAYFKLVAERPGNAQTLN